MCVWYILYIIRLVVLAERHGGEDDELPQLANFNFDII